MADQPQSKTPLIPEAVAAPSEPRTYQPSALRLMTDRQLECLAWVQRGKSATDIGGILGLSGRTVEKHLNRACNHLGVRTRLQAVIRARELGLMQEGGA